MSGNSRGFMQSEFMGKLMVAMAARSSRNRSLLDRLCRRALNRLTALPPEEDFMRDPLIDNDEGFDPEELDRYQRGE
ncbi:MAG: hypothetical protein GWP63_17490 [Haliea sp.]|nr:hypothetical protein [Haliea sp.]